MASTTDRFGLNRIVPGAKLQDDGYKFGDADRVLIDRLLRLGAEDHHHTGAAASSTLPGVPVLTLALAGGSIPSGTRVFYAYTLVDVDGNETVPSAPAFVDTPAPVLEPGAPTLAASAVGGTLLPGQHFYVVSAYTTVNTQETRCLAPAPITVPAGTSTNQVTLTMPSPPDGATGFNIYRKGPGDARYNYLASIPVATLTYSDTGGTEPDCNRTIPSANNTNGANAVTVDIGDAGFDPPSGMTWKLYRSYASGVWASSLLHHVVEETAEGSGIITPTHQDLGLNTSLGAPPSASQQVRSPAKVLLTDGAEVQGLLPMARVSGFPFMVTFAFVGSLVGTFQGSTVWVNEFPRATIIGVRAALGRGSSPAAQPDIFDVNVGSGASPTMASVFSDVADRPQVPVGDQIGDRVLPTAVSEMLVGDCLTADLVQGGGGATPTDIDASINVYLLAHGFDESTWYPGVDLRAPTGLIAWYKEAGFGVLTGQPIVSWANAAPGAVGAAAQATAGLRPTRLDAVLNGHAVAVFSADRLKTPGFGPLTQPVTVFLVARNTSLVGAQVFIDGDSGEFLLHKDTFPHYVGGGALTGPIADTDWHIFCFQANGASSVLRVDGGPGVTGNASSTPLGAISMGALGAADTSFLIGQVAEALVYHGARTVADLNVVGRYLAERFALSWVDVA